MLLHHTYRSTSFESRQRFERYVPYYQCALFILKVISYRVLGSATLPAFVQFYKLFDFYNRTKNLATFSISERKMIGSFLNLFFYTLSVFAIDFLWNYSNRYEQLKSPHQHHDPSIDPPYLFTAEAMMNFEYRALFLLSLLYASLFLKQLFFLLCAINPLFVYWGEHTEQMLVLQEALSGLSSGHGAPPILRRPTPIIVLPAGYTPPFQRSPTTFGSPAVRRRGGDFNITASALSPTSLISPTPLFQSCVTDTETDDDEEEISKITGHMIPPGHLSSSLPSFILPVPSNPPSPAPY
jgi:hypothetical protein